MDTPAACAQNPHMGWLPPADDGASFEALLRHRPELAALYKQFYGTFWDDALLPRALLELCRLRIAQVHGCDAELAIDDEQAALSPERRQALERWQDADCYAEDERAALVLAEKMPWQHHEITDGEFAHMRSLLGERGAVALMVALALFDANCRLKLVFGLNPAPATVPQPASAAGPLY